jgi:flagellar basal-body rod protein FlgF
MDRSTYIAMSGAAQIMRAQAEVSHNLANANTVGFKAQLSAFKSLPVQGPGAPTRINAVDDGSGFDHSAGPIVTTGRDLDVAVKGKGWIAVQAPDGSEAYTRAGNLQVDATGLLTDARGNPVIGDGGPITIPPTAHVQIGEDGTISMVPQGQTPNTLSSVARIKLVDPAAADLRQGSDGLMHLANGATAPADAGVQLVSGSLESSNVKATDMLVRMIELSRQFEMNVRSITTAKNDAQSASQLLRLS